MTFFLNFWQNGIKKIDLEFICDQNGKEFQKVRITHEVETPRVSWLIILLVKPAPLSCP